MAAENLASIAQSAHKKVSDQSFTSEQREQAFNLLAMMMDRFQDMLCRLQNPNKLEDDATLDRACQQFGASEHLREGAVHFFARTRRRGLAERRKRGKMRKVPHK